MAGKRVSVTLPPPPGSIANSSSLPPSLGTRARPARWRQLMRSCGIAPTGDSSSRSVARASSDTYGHRVTPTVQGISRTEFSGVLLCCVVGVLGWDRGELPRGGLATTRNKIDKNPMLAQNRTRSFSLASGGTICFFLFAFSNFSVLRSVWGFAFGTYCFTFSLFVLSFCVKCEP